MQNFQNDNNNNNNGQLHTNTKRIRCVSLDLNLGQRNVTRILLCSSCSCCALDVIVDLLKFIKKYFCQSSFQKEIGIS